MTGEPGVNAAGPVMDPAVTWQEFSADRPLGPGDYRILARATDGRGRVQPQAGARNQIHAVSLRVHGTS